MPLQTCAQPIASFRQRPRALRLECRVQHYDWGDPQAIPDLLGQANPQRRPFAELWAGAHPDLPSLAHIDDQLVPLDLLIREAPEQILGPELATRFQGELPFLLKILAAAKPLSIQAHPGQAQAVSGFEREARLGVPLDAPTRTYRDRHHKPELLVALSEFYALRGFRPLAGIEAILANIPEFSPLIANGLGDAQALAGLYGHLMGLQQPQVNALLRPLIERLERDTRHRAFKASEPAYWLLRAHRDYSAPGRIDRGLFSILLLNLIRLRPGQGIYLPAGELHAYLRGVGIEIMANSNNVLRGGLTNKHVNPQELLRVLSFQGRPGELVEPQTATRKPRVDRYQTPTAEFALSALTLPAETGTRLPAGCMRLGLPLGGTLSVAADDSPPLHLRPGQALLLPPTLGCRISGPRGTRLWLAQVP